METAAAPAIPRSIPHQDRVFHTGIAIAMLITAVIGFGPTYFYKPFRPSPPLDPLRHVHGMAFTAWLLLLIVQSGLIRTKRVEVHMRLGILGAVLAASMVVLGIMVGIHAARRGFVADGLNPLAFMIFPFGQAVLFGIFVGLGLLYRRKPEIHRRFILLGSITILTPAISRIVDKRSVLASFLTLAFVVVAMLQDWLSRRKVHPIYVCGFLILFASGPIRAAIANTAAWQSFAHMLVG